jgi:hypothetical protein
MVSVAYGTIKVKECYFARSSCKMSVNIMSNSLYIKFCLVKMILYVLACVVSLMALHW